MSYPLPPLNAYRAFETAARTGGYVAAAKELGVSPAAVSGQVRNLEDYLGKELFTRFNNRIALTDAGQAIFAGVSESLREISELSEKVKSGSTRSRLIVSVLPSVANRWLAPKLAWFAAHEQALRIEIRVEEDPIDFIRHNIDLRICYGTNLFPEMRTVHLKQDEVLPMCSPIYLKRNSITVASGMEAVADDHLIHTNWGPSFASQPTWQSWFAKADSARRPSEASGCRVNMSSLALDLARDGVGVALGQRMMAQDDLISGRLIPMSTTSLPLGHSYKLVYPHSKERKLGLQALISYLTGDSGPKVSLE